MATEQDGERAEDIDFQSVFEHSPDAILVHDAESGAVVDANAAAVELFGSERETLSGQTLADLRPQGTDGDSGLFQRAVVEGSARARWEIQQAEKTRWVDVRMTVPDGDTALTYLRDLTERERKLEENDAILTQLTETTDDVFWMFDGDFSELEFVNDAYEEVWGRSVDAVREDPMDFMEGVHPDDRAMVADAVERLRAGESTDHEYRVNPEEEYGRWVWVRGEPIFDDDGNVERIAGFARDITDRKERERELERSERQFDAVFNDPQLLVALLGTDGTVQRVNETAVEFADVDSASMTGDPFAETPWWSHDEELQERLQSWLQQAASGEYVEYEAEHPLPGGGEMNANGTIRPVTDDDGTVRSLIASARDVTERVERERELEESNKRLEQFAYVASHDLQEPLRTISNFIELIEDEYGDELDEEADRLIDIVVTGSERMQSMIDGLLDYSRVTTRGKEFEPVDTDAVAEGVVDDLTVKLEEESGNVHWDDLPTVEADPDQLRQVFQNLVKNALEHSEGPVDIEIRATETPDGYRFEVEDDGPGIDPSRHEKIFRIFKSGKQYQTSSQAKGIGLAICDNIVQRHGGELWVESDLGEGATFGFTIDTDQ